MEDSGKNWAGCSWSSAVCRPGAHQSPYGHQLSQVVGVVVGHQKRFAQQGLALAVRNRGEQVIGRAGHQVLHGPQVSAECLDAAVPGSRGGTSVAAGPVAVRKGWRDVRGAASELPDGPL